MRGRFEAQEIHWRTAKTLTAVLLLFNIASSNITAQELPPAVTLLLEQMGEDGSSGTESLALALEKLMEHPADINSLSGEELLSLPMLTQFQAASILEHRRDFGDILSVGELALVDGFNAVTAELLAPFIRFGGELPRPSRAAKVTTWMRARCSGTGSAYLRYRGEYGDTLAWGVTAAQDAGERAVVPDFLSGYLEWSPRRLRGVRVMAGDIAVRLGQGLTFWNGFTMNGFSDPSSVVRTSKALSPYTSTDELDFCRGAGVQMKAGRGWEAVLFGSFNAVDARSDSVYYYSLPDDGLHDTESAVAARHSMREYVAGGSISKKGERYRVRLNGVCYSYSKHNLRSVREDNEYQMYDGWWGNFSADWTVSIPSIRGRIFGEAALDADLHPAVTAGLTSAPVSKVEAAVTLRYYHPRYIAPHAGGYTVSTGCYNEYGALLSLRWNAAGRLTFRLFGDVARHPYPRYRIPAGSSSAKVRVNGEFRANAACTFLFQCGMNYKSYVEKVKYTCRAEYRFSSPSGFFSGSRAEVSVLGRAGYLVYQEFGYAAPTGLWSLFLRGTAYHVDDWDNRIYCYQRGLAGVFSVPAAYGRGVEVYLTGGVRPLKWLKISAKASVVPYSSRDLQHRWTLGGQVTVSF